ncbi:unnamed protein product [Linum trigynum]|uniref:Uncharacterized protein n=1 Tax=Linum trigynum TaxID=586398 RepID=A0AAV2FM64_9ROSI
MKLITAKPFSEEVGHLVLRSNLRGKDGSPGDVILDKVTIKFDMLSLFVKKWIVVNVKSSLVVAMKNHGTRLNNTKFAAKGTKPKYLTSNTGHGSVLSLD